MENKQIEEIIETLYASLSRLGIKHAILETKTEKQFNEFSLYACDLQKSGNVNTNKRCKVFEIMGIVIEFIPPNEKS